ncbi:gliding motility-associated C-terminal domain-containing protein [Spongiivirga citrea]|uniref:T9SS type B sorting domain-containing protein n=1 Tax=Spongiivirga citrea TaxID=1481457 RepID=A0A6M0CRB1_9FLAO|nr:gliding motility-associated C-terminal domain-containing protein [Spongiivirga citrea]NER18614.1 T9SS type B sorting domain-containing protein [Spongiivirga citrea]
MHTPNIITTLLFFCNAIVLQAQVAFQNNGNLQIHDEGQIGFHIDLINQGVFNQNLGLAGFYSQTNPLIVSGNTVVFNDLEVDVANNLFIRTGVGVTNGTNFITGLVVTDRNTPNISLDFINDSFYSGVADARHTDGYASISGNDAFTFPIGDDNRFRPMSVSASSLKQFYSGAYFFEDPNSPSTFSTNFNTNTRQERISTVNPTEFWDLDGPSETSVTLTWDANSNVNFLADEIEDFVVVGWNINDAEWQDLGNTLTAGDITSGSVTSAPFIPDEYAVLTIGSANTETQSLNYGISPDGDGVNDVLVIEATRRRTENHLEIFNRWGVKVYEADGYNNNWDGTSDGRVTISRDKGLPVGTYFYILEFKDNGERATGYIYINR